MSRRIAMFTGAMIDYISAPLINSAEYLGSQGYHVDIFALASEGFAAPSFVSSNISYVPYKRVSLHGIPRTTFLFTLYCVNKMMGRIRYDFLIGFDPPGLINAALLARLRQTPYVYHSLEIVPEATLVGWHQKVNKWIERRLNAKAALTITQDDQRAELLARENHLDRSRIAVVYNSPLGVPMPEKSTWLRDRFRIPPSKSVVLLAGSLVREHMVDVIAGSVESWPTECVLVLHGWFSYGNEPDSGRNSIETEIRQLAQKYPDRIFVSTTVLPYAERHLVFRSADIGLIFYNPLGDNHRYVGAAAGKLFDFMQCGVPVIALDLPGMKELVEATGAGLVVRDITEIPEAVPTILHNYAHHVESSLLAFGQYSFVRSYERALGRIRREQDSNQQSETGNTENELRGER